MERRKGLEPDGTGWNAGLLDKDSSLRTTWFADPLGEAAAL